MKNGVKTYVAEQRREKQKNRLRAHLKEKKWRMIVIDKFVEL